MIGQRFNSTLQNIIWMHTPYCMNHSHPYTIQWNKDELLIPNYKITKDIFAVFIRYQLDKLETIIWSDILFNISLESIGIKTSEHLWIPETPRLAGASFYLSCT